MGESGLTMDHAWTYEPLHNSFLPNPIFIPAFHIALWNECATSDKELIMLEFQPIDRVKRSSEDSSQRYVRQEQSLPPEYLSLLQQLVPQQRAAAQQQQPIIEQLLVARDGNKQPAAARYLLHPDGRIVRERLTQEALQQQQYHQAQYVQAPQGAQPTGKFQLNLIQKLINQNSATSGTPRTRSLLPPTNPNAARLPRCPNSRPNRGSNGATGSPRCRTASRWTPIRSSPDLPPRR